VDGQRMGTERPGARSIESKRADIQRSTPLPSLSSCARKVGSFLSLATSAKANVVLRTSRTSVASWTIQLYRRNEPKIWGIAIIRPALVTGAMSPRPTVVAVMTQK